MNKIKTDMEEKYLSSKTQKSGIFDQINSKKLNGYQSINSKFQLEKKNALNIQFN